MNKASWPTEQFKLILNVLLSRINSGELQLEECEIIAEDEGDRTLVRFIVVGLKPDRKESTGFLTD